MADEARKISIQVQATKAISQLQKLGAALETIGAAVGSTDSVLRNLDQQIAKIPGVASNASTAIANLKKEVKTLTTAQTASTTSAVGANASANAKITNSDAQRFAFARQQNALAIKQADALRNAELKNMREIIQSRYKVAGATSETTRGIQGTTRAVNQLQDTVQQNALRYQLYDVAATLGIVGAAGLAAGLAVTKAGVEWDKNFANVVRTSQTTGTAVTWLKDQFLELQTVVPVTSANLAEIATLGSQMGVSANAISNFTKITAEFSATSGLNVDESATALSRLNQLLPDVDGNYERLASTILRTGVNAVATEAQITRGTSQIASMGQIAGLTTPEVVALSSAMSSLGFSPELQRSVITSSFSKILTATSDVSDKTEKFGAVLKMTGKEFQAAWRADAIGTFRNLLTTIASRGDAVTVLQDLGLASQRLTPNLLKLGQNSEVLNAALSDTRDEWGKNTEQARQYGIISDTVAARLQILGQSWEALLVTLDDSDTVIKPLIEGLTSVVKWLRTVADTPGISAFATLGTAIVTLTAVVALGAAALAGMSAGYIAITNATRGLTLMTAENAGVTAVNTTTIIGNTVAREANAGVSVAQTGAIAGNTAAMGANAAATSAAGTGLLGFTGKAISALGPILKWTGIVGLAAAAVTGLISVLATSPDWTLDMEQHFAGADTPAKKIAFDTTRITETQKAAEDAIEAQKKSDKEYASFRKKQQKDLDRENRRLGPRNQRTSIDPGFMGLGERQAASKQGNAAAQATLKNAAAYRNLEKALMDIQNPADQLRALNDASKGLGISTGDLLKKLPGLASLLGDGAVAAADMEEQTRKLDGAQMLWAVSLNTTEKNLASLKDGVSSGAKSFLDFGSALTDAYDKDPENGEGFKSFTKTIDKQISGFETFYGNLGELVQRGGVQLATLFASQGQDSAQALTDALKLSPEQLAQIESQMSLAQFYTSDEFANTFAQNNAILAKVWQASGHDPAAVKAFSDALSASMKGGSVDPGVLAGLADKFGIDLNVDMIPDMDETQFDTARALLEAKVKPIKIPVTTTVGQGDFTVTNEIDAWVVEMEGHSITMKVDPNTDRGRSIIAQWRENEYQVPVELRTVADTTLAGYEIDRFIAAYAGRRIPLYVSAMKDKNGRPINLGAFATGALVQNGRAYRDNYPGYASGTIVRGPGSGTSDSMLARISNGEAITQARAVRYYGTRMMEDINHMRFPRYATGMTPAGYAGSGEGPRQVINATVVQNYPTTRDPIKTLKQDAEAVIAGIWA